MLFNEVRAQIVSLCEKHNKITLLHMGATEHLLIIAFGVSRFKE